MTQQWNLLAEKPAPEWSSALKSEKEDSLWQLEGA